MKNPKDTTNDGNITVRRPDFGLDKDFEQHWFAGNPILTHLFNASWLARCSKD